MSNPGTGPTEPDAIKAEIEQTRAQLGRTVDELSSRLDVPTRAKDTAVETYRESPPAIIGAGAAVTGLLGLLVWRRRTRPQRQARREVKREARRAEKALAARRAATEKMARKAAKKNAKARKKAKKKAARRTK